ncbi:hypothetical protein ACNPQN_32800 [Streptomyces sp. NPDC056297]|uniref:hypothetical protein n=1 Tax=unclassified Streptomyces TaxID=2593676 RepID=UPI0035E11AC4
MNEAFNAEAARLVDSLVASGGGLVSYELGAPGQKIALAAGVQLASESGRSLTVVDFRHMLPQIRVTIAELVPDLPCTLLPLGEAIEHPERFTGGILVLHSGLLNDADTRKALLALAGTADSVIVAALADVDQSVLNSLPGPRFVASAPVLMQRPGRVDRTPGIDLHFEAVANVDPLAGLKERKERLIRQIRQGAPGGRGQDLEEVPETVSFEEFEELAEAMQNAVLGQHRQNTGGAEEQQRQRAAERASAALPSSLQEQDGAVPRHDALDAGLPEPGFMGRGDEHRIDAGAWEGDIAASKERFVDQLSQGPQGDGSELAELLSNVDPDELQERIAQLAQRQRQRAEDHPAPGLPQETTRQHAQEQSAAHHQQQRQSPGLT